MKRIPISAVIVIRNEGKRLREYFEHLKPYVDEFVVADQCSSDNSVEICKEYGARVFITKNWGFSEPDKEFILKQIKNDWAITLDPDERFDNAILTQLQQIINKAEDNGCDGVCFNVHFILDGYKIDSLSGAMQERIIKKGVRCHTKIHSNYMLFNPMHVNLPQYHFKYSDDTKEKELKRLDFQTDLGKDKTIVKNLKMTEELNSHILHTIEYNKNVVSDILQFPKKVIIETSVNCNSNCIMCPNHKIKRINRDMDNDLFNKIIDQCVGKDVEEIHPFMHGEPFIVTDIFDKMQYINDKLPNTKIVLFTNAGLLDEDKSKKLLKIKNIESITFSIDAFTEDTYKRIRRNMDFNQVKTNILKFLELNKSSENPIKTCVSMTISNYNENEYIDYHNYWKDKVDYIDGHRCTGRNKEIETFGDIANISHFKQIPCSILFNTMCITTDGDVTMCCEDFTPLVKLGNVFETSIEQVWNSSRFNEIRQKHIVHKRYELDVCKDCNVCM